MGIAIVRNDILIRKSAGHVVKHPTINRSTLEKVETHPPVTREFVLDRERVRVYDDGASVRVSYITTPDKMGHGTAVAQNPQSPIERMIRFNSYDDIGFPATELVCWGGVWMHVSYVGELNNMYTKWLSMNNTNYPKIPLILEWHRQITNLFIARLANRVRTVKNRNGNVGDTFNVHAESHLFQKQIDARTDTILNRTSKTWGTRYAPKDWSE